jgi:hypothetical protein
LSPKHCKQLIERFPDVDLVVQRSPSRAFSDSEYDAEGIRLVDNLSDRELIIGVKEVPIEQLISGKAYLFFSHTTKKQPYNKALLQAIIDKEITLMDHELLENVEGERVIAFGRYAGLVGAYNGLRAYALQEFDTELKPAHECHDLSEMEKQLDGLRLPADFRVILTGTGRVGGGAIEILQRAGIQEASLESIQNNSNSGPCYHALDTEDMYVSASSGTFDKEEFYVDPSGYRSLLAGILQDANMYIACHYWNPKGPMLLSKDEFSELSRLRIIADISCDIEKPIASTLRASTIADPFYGYDPVSGSEVPFRTKESIGVMAVDNLPCELPRDSSLAFGQQFMDHVASNVIQDDPSGMIQRATIVEQGTLTPSYQYLAEWLLED